MAEQPAHNPKLRATLEVLDGVATCGQLLSVSTFMLWQMIANRLAAFR